MKRFYLCLLSLFCLSVFSQRIQTIHIQTEKSKGFNLSSIAEQIHPIGLEMNQEHHFDCISDVLWSKEYLFVSVYSLNVLTKQRLPIRILQYDFSGKLIREIGEQSTNIRKLMCDTIKSRLFIPKGREVSSYDFDGILQEKYFLKDVPYLYDKNYFWIHHTDPHQGEMHYHLIGYDLLSKKEVNIHTYSDSTLKVGSALLGRTAGFSFYDHMPCVAFGLDNMLHRIEGDKIVPFVRFNIEPAIATLEKVQYQFQGFIGNYLCINYITNNQFYLYMKCMSTGQEFQTQYRYSKEGILTNGIKDDILATGFCDIEPLNRTGYFYFIKNREELIDNPNIHNKNVLYTIFLVRLKH